MNRPKNRKKRNARSRSRPSRKLTTIATGCALLGLWSLSSFRPAGDSVRLSSVPEWPAQTWNQLLEPLRSERFQLGRIEFMGLEQLDGDVLAERLGLAPQPLIDVDPNAACEALLEKTPRLESCSAMRLPPNQLLISVRERRPIARLAEDGRGIDAEGSSFVLGPGDRAGLPVLSGDLDTARGALALTLEAGLEVSAVHAEKADDIRIELQGSGASLRIGGDLERSLERWNRLRAQLSLAEIGAREVDTRFRGQVVLRDGEGPTPVVDTSEED